MQTRTASGSLKRKAYDEVEDDDSNKNEIKDTPQPKRKRVKTHSTDDPKPDKGLKIKRNGKGKEKATPSIYKGRNVGKLAKLLEMPMDIFCEISKHLQPLDLLQLSRSTQSFNRILMSRGSKPIWRAARATHSELPECPPDMSEPEYARLLFLKECHVCLASRAMKVDYHLRARLCRRCRASHILNGEVLLRTIPDLTEELLECLPCESTWYIGQSCKIKSFYKAAAERIVSQYNKAVPVTLSEQERQKAKGEFIESRRAMLLQIPKNVGQLTEWASNQVYAKQTSDNEAIKRRQEAIHAKLLESGHTERDIPPSNFSLEWNNILQQPRDLTSRIWTSIRPKLENHIAAYKTFREEKDRSDRKRTRRLELQGHLQKLLNGLAANNPKFYFPVDHAITLSTCADIIKENDYGNVITEEKWTEIQEQVLNEVNATIEESESLLISTITSLDTKQIPKSLTIPEVFNKEFLSASTTYFACNQCKFGTRYPQLRRHTCYHGLSSTNLREAGFTFDPLRTAVAQTLLASLPEADNTDDVATKFIKCNVCLTRMQWSHLLRHFYPADMRHPSSHYFHTVAPNTHTLEEAIQGVEGRPLISIEDDEYDEYDENNGYGGWDDDADSYYGDYDIYGYDDDYGYGGLTDSDLDGYGGFYDDQDQCNIM
ncbi:hypothetical protein Clacol_008812 [Clathrus columnatus]|uniref:F-box domain-containing protein n=1 Tax=Clathrus columnatus TaxID=1419009 RepID=A0AAV5ALI7_9AGAM|nr:hypothetical protein Clacol_008812 [Clathrus columnatus]